MLWPIPWWQKPKAFLLFTFIRFREMSLWPESKRGKWDTTVILAKALSKNWASASALPAWLLEPGTLNAERLMYGKVYQCGQAHLTSVCSWLIEVACAVPGCKWIVQASFCLWPWCRDFLLILVWTQGYIQLCRWHTGTYKAGWAERSARWHNKLHWAHILQLPDLKIVNNSY